MGLLNLFKKNDQAKEALNRLEDVAPAPPAESRAVDRDIVYRDSRIHLTTGGTEPCIINDVSETGLRISCQVAKSLPEIVRVAYGGNKRLCKVVWVDGIVAGLQFVDDAN